MGKNFTRREARLVETRTGTRLLSAVMTGLLGTAFLLISCTLQAPQGQALEASLGKGMGLAVEAGDAPVQPLSFVIYAVSRGDTLSGIAERFNLRTDTLITFNDIKRSRALQIGAQLKIPNQDGLQYKVKDKDTLDAIAEKFEVPAQDILKANRIFEADFKPGALVFLPGARLDDAKLREINGDLFRWPVGGYISSGYGYRRDPFTGQRSFHNAIDIAAAEGAPVRAAMEGRVSATGYSSGSGNYISISHHTGYSTVYAHLKAIHVEEGQWVSQGQSIGAAGNTGYSTGVHLHFVVFQWGRSINPLYVLH